MNPFDFFTKEATVADATTPPNPTDHAAVPVSGLIVASQSGDDAPVQEALDAILDSWIAAFSRRPVIHAGLVACRGMVDLTAPLVRSALAAKGFKIVRA